MRVVRYFAACAALALIGCTQDTSTPEAEPAPMAAAPAVEIAAEETQTMAPVRYNEFIWCSNGENGTSENVAARNALWVEQVTALGLDQMGAAELVPTGWTTENFDRLTLLMWPDVATRDAGWAAYGESTIEAQLEEQFPNVEICGGEDFEHVYGLNVYQPRMPTTPFNPEGDAKAYVEYQFCSYNEGQEAADLRAVVGGPYMAFLDGYTETRPDSSYNFLVQVPQFDQEAVERADFVPPSFDFVWTNFYGTPAEKAEGDSVWAEQGAPIQAAFDEVVACSDPLGYDLSMLKRTAG